MQVFIHSLLVGGVFEWKRICANIFFIYLLIIYYLYFR
jgi:hypothetical protein